MIAQDLHCHIIRDVIPDANFSVVYLFSNYIFAVSILCLYTLLTAVGRADGRTGLYRASYSVGTGMYRHHYSLFY